LSQGGVVTKKLQSSHLSFPLFFMLASVKKILFNTLASMKKNRLFFTLKLLFVTLELLFFTLQCPAWKKVIPA
jgi:hypothetical protein